jgi:hypothetical protein
MTSVDKSPLIIEENVEAFLDAHGLGAGPVVRRGSVTAAGRTSPS